MKTLIVYGTHRETGELKCLFSTLFPSMSCIRRAKVTADDNGYDIARVELSSAWNKPFQDVTKEFLEADCNVWKEIIERG